jgi:flagellar hook-associated protein 2
MAVSSTSGSSNSGVATIDVASVVDQLMKVENKPLDVLNGRIDQQKLVISDLGAIKSKISLFQDALKSFQNPNSYNSVDVTYTDG